MKDLAKRKRVMARSMELGHCICDPKKSCPCDVFREQDLCPCAGERPAPLAGPVRLTALVASAGCASKIDAATLRRVLADLPEIGDPAVLVGAPAGDDAGVYRLDDERALVQTVDVFTPSVDDPYTFGQIAAANSLSDVYAMGGRPLTALSIVGFPVREVAEEVLRAILRGGLDKMAEAGVPVIGGHSINDPEIKAGFAVTGLVHPQGILTHASARPGDSLILTKPLGTGLVAFAAQIGRAPPGAAEAAARAMAALNRQAAALAVEYGAGACTDVTGFGLAGHLGAMAAASGVDVEVVLDDLPLLPGVVECLTDGIIPGGVERNRESSAHLAVVDASVDPRLMEVCFDPQTSGGLLLAVAAEKGEELLRRLYAAGVAEAAVIGRVLDAGSGRVHVRSGGRRRLARRPPAPRTAPPPPIAAEPACCAETEKPQADSGERAMTSCCAGPDGVEDAGAAAPAEQFQGFLKAAAAPGALDGRTKRAIAIALSVLAKCEPCLAVHVRKAREEDFTQEQIDEAAWMAIAFGGSPTMMFYNARRKP